MHMPVAVRVAAESAASDVIKLLVGLVLLLAAGFIYWISPGYERLYRKLFGRAEDY
jgi:hypothetical protein